MDIHIDRPPSEVLRELADLIEIKGHRHCSSNPAIDNLIDFNIAVIAAIQGKGDTRPMDAAAQNIRWWLMEKKRG